MDKIKFVFTPPEGALAIPLAGEGDCIMGSIITDEGDNILLTGFIMGGLSVVMAVEAIVSSQKMCMALTKQIMDILPPPQALMFLHDIQLRLKNLAKEDGEELGDNIFSFSLVREINR